ncbi:MAG: metal ABC transporter permease [Hyphomicrobiales bacterium]|nr:metal ABC transporter permease [Hyphomicrobiales bacterium]
MPAGGGMSPVELLFAPFVEVEVMKRALVGGFALSLGAVPVGVFLMLRRMSLIGDALSHAILPGIAVGYFISGLSLTVMTLGGLATGLAVALLSGLIARATTLKEDTSFAALLIVALALGVAIVSLKGADEELVHLLFGDVEALDRTAVMFLAVAATLSLAVLALIYRPLVMECVDPLFLRSVSRAGGVAHLTFLVLMVLNMVAGFRALGTLMAIGIMIVPAAAAQLWARSVPGLIVAALAIGLASCWLGLAGAYHLRQPPGPAVVLAAGLFYALSVLFGRAGGLIRRLPPAPHLEA